MASNIRKTLLLGAIISLAAMTLSQSQAQAPRPPTPAPTEFWYFNKTSGAYEAPNRPLWKQADLVRMHAGQNNWSQQIVKDDWQEATYNSAAPGTKVIPQMHMKSATAFVVLKGEMHFTVEGQQPVTATRGSIVNIMPSTIYSYEVQGSQNALFININPRGAKLVYPSAEPPPPAMAGTTVTKVAFDHKPGAYTGVNKLHFNLFEAIAACQPVSPAVADEHLRIGPILGWNNPADVKCPGANTGNTGRELKNFNPKSSFGHLHHDVVEWWIVQSGAISGKFENVGEFHAVEGDVLYAAPDMWHQMHAEAPNGPSVRTAITAYPLTNMLSTAGGTVDSSE